MTFERELAANRALWDEWVDVNARSELYGLEEFKAGGVKIPQFMQDEVGDVTGKSLLHLQCHFGMDTLSWARLGASVTGVDFSPRAVEFATQLAEQLSIEASFVQADVLELDRVLEGEFDIVFTSIGAVNWLPDLGRWGEVVAHFVKPGGFFYICDLDPFSLVFDDEAEKPELRFRYPYFTRDEPIEVVTKGSYADQEADVKQPVHYDWVHDMGEIVTVLAEAGLRIEFLHEHPFGIEVQFPFMQKGADGLYRLPVGMPEIPLLFSLRARKD